MGSTIWRCCLDRAIFDSRTTCLCSSVIVTKSMFGPTLSSGASVVDPALSPVVIAASDDSRRPCMESSVDMAGKLQATTRISQ